MKIYEIEVNLRSVSQGSFDLYLHCLKVYIKIYYLACFEVLKSNISLEFIQNVLCHDNSAIRLPKTSTHGSRTADSLAFTCIPNLIQECRLFSLEYFREIANNGKRKVNFSHYSLSAILLDKNKKAASEVEHFSPFKDNFREDRLLF